MNVPRDAEGNVTDDHRLKESMPAVKMALKGGAGVMVCSHLGRPKEGELTEQDSLAKGCRNVRQDARHADPF